MTTLHIERLATVWTNKTDALRVPNVCARDEHMTDIKHNSKNEH